MSTSTSISQVLGEDTEVKTTTDDRESGNWSVLDDTEIPYNWTNKRKWLLTVVFCLNNFMVSVGASIFTPGIGLIAYDFDITIVVATLGLSFYVIGFSMGPLIFAPMSEVYGRKIVYVPTWTLFVIFQIGCALAKNIETLVICRLLVGTFGSPALTVAAGTMTDIWKPNELGPPMGLFTMAAFLGPVVGPIAGGFITEYIHSSEPWRWSFWIPFIISSILGLNWFWLPETYQFTLLENKAKKAGHKALHMEGKKSNAAIFRVAIWRPLHMLVFEPTVLLVSLYISFLFGILYLYFGAYPLIFQGRYHWGPGFSGLAFVGIGIGVILSFLTAGYSNKLYLQLKEKRGKGDAYPEGRLPVAIFAALLVPGSIFWFAWSGFARIHWIVPILSGIPFGWSMVVLFISLISYLAEGYIEYSASVIAANTILRSLFAMAFPLFGRTMYTSMKPEWAGTLLGCISILFMPIPFLFFKYGWWLRRNSRYPTKQQEPLDQSRGIEQDSVPGGEV